MNQNHPIMPVKHFTYPLGFSLYHALFALVFGSVALLAFGGSVYTIASFPRVPAATQVATFVTSLIESLAVLLFAALIAAMPLFFFVSLLTAYPTISLTEKGYRVQVLWYKSRWLAWNTLLRVGPFYPSRDMLHSLGRWFGVDSTHSAYMITAAGLGRAFWLNGLFYGMGRSTFCISPFIINYHDLMQTLRQKRPDLFYT